MGDPLTPMGESTLHDAVAASLMVHYRGDCFGDEEEDDDNFEDVVRHATSKCNGLIHLRQLVSLVQAQHPLLTLQRDGNNPPCDEKPKPGTKQHKHADGQ